MQKQIGTLSQTAVSQVGRLYSEALGTVVTSSPTPTDFLGPPTPEHPERTGGPMLVLDVGRPCFLTLFLEAEIAVNTSDGAVGQVLVDVTGYTRQAVVKFNPNVGGENVFNKVEHGQSAPNIFGVASTIPLDPGQVTIATFYNVAINTGTASFRNRRMWASLG